MAPRKRAIDVVDLTGDEPASSSQSYSGPSSSQSYSLSQPSSSQSRAPKQARTGSARNTNSFGGSGLSQDQVFAIFDSEEDEAQEDPDTDEYNATEMNYGLYGTSITKIVGCRFYYGYATIGELVILRREPNNPYDSNAIQVLNVQGEQIGHIPRNMASKLAPFMDSRSLLIEGIISGPKGHYDCPVSVRLYGTNEPVERENLIARMRQVGLPVQGANNAVRQEQKAMKERQKLAAQVTKMAKKNGAAVVGMEQGMQWETGMAEFAGGASRGLGGPGPSLEDIMVGSQRFNPRHADQVIEEFGVKEEDLAAMPKATQPQALATELHPFQLQGLQWMLDKESPQLPTAGSQDVVQLWKRHPSMRDAFTNVATNFSIKNPSLASGGILADDMGLGKTIQVISLIMADRELNRRAKDTCNASLILAPVSVMSNWSTQMKKHIKEEHALRIMFYHGSRKEPITPKHITDYDIVITTYDSVSSEWHSQKSTTLPRNSGVFSMKWRRIILDEGHNIRNPKAKKTIAVTSLMAQSRWALTGTPIINNLKDLFSLVRFLRLSGGLDSLGIFNGAIIRPVSQGVDTGNRALQLLMGSICLRRKKEMSFIDLRLPELSEYVHKIDLLPHEREKYDALEAQAKGTLDTYRNNLKGGRKAQDTYRHLLEVLLRMRQLCNHWKLVGEERLDSIMSQLEAEGVVDLTEENKNALQKMLQLSIDSQEDCPICLDTFKDPVITKCAHIFCSPCLERVIETQHKCPMCRAELDTLATTTVKPAQETLPAPPPTQEQLKDKASLESSMPSKITTLLSILTATSKKDPTAKTIIFSQWTSFLDLLSPFLTASNFSHTRIDGRMTPTARDAAIHTLDTDPSTPILLASLSVCSVGLNLVSANHVILADSWWAPAIEDQAVDRVHRLGQKRETYVWRLVVRDSVEERVLGIQEEKRRLMGVAFAEKEDGAKRRGRGAGRGVQDLVRLLGAGGGEAGASASTS